MLKLPTIELLMEKGLRYDTTDTVIRFPFFVSSLGEYNSVYVELSYVDADSVIKYIPYSLTDEIFYPMPITVMELNNEYNVSIDRTYFDGIPVDPITGLKEVIVHYIVNRTIIAGDNFTIKEDYMKMGTISLFTNNAIEFVTSPIITDITIPFASLELDIVIDKLFDKTFTPINIMDLIRNGVTSDDIKLRIASFITLKVETRNSNTVTYSDCTDDFLSGRKYIYIDAGTNNELTFRISITKLSSDILVNIVGDVDIKIPDNVSIL